MAKGKSPIDIEINLSAMRELEKLTAANAENLRKSKEFLIENIELTKRLAGLNKDLNREFDKGESRENRRASRRARQPEEDLSAFSGIFDFGQAPTVGPRNARGQFTKLKQPHPTWSRPKDAGPTGQFSAGWEKPPRPGSLSDLDRLPWGPSRNAGPSGRFSAGWEKPPRPGSSSDLDRLPWGPGRDSTGSGQFKAEWLRTPKPLLPWDKPQVGSGERYHPKGGYHQLGDDPFTKAFAKFDKNNMKMNETFFNLLTSGRLGHDLIRGMLSGNLMKIVGGAGIAGAAAYGLSEVARAGAQSRVEALTLGTNYGTLQSARINLARFGAVDPGIQGAELAKFGVGPQFQGYTALGLKPDKNSDPAILYAQGLMKAGEQMDEFLKQGKDPHWIQSWFESRHITEALGGDIGKIVGLAGRKDELKQAEALVESDKKLLNVSENAQKGLSDLSADFERAGGIMLSGAMEFVGGIGNAITTLRNKGLFTSPDSPYEMQGGVPVLKNKGDDDPGKFVGDIIGGGGQKPVPEVPPVPEMKKTPQQRAYEIQLELLNRNARGRGQQTLNSRAGNPPDSSTIEGDVIADDRPGGVIRVGVFTPKIEKLNKEVDDNITSFDQFNKLLMSSSNILIDLNKAMKDNRKWWDTLGTGAIAGIGKKGAAGGVAGGAAGVFGAGGVGPGGVQPVKGGAGGVAGGAAGVPGAGGVGPGATPAAPAKGALAANQKEAYKAARESGLSDSSARALVANMTGEGLATPGDVHWDSTHTARGIVQWDPERSEAIRQKFGKYPNEMSVAEQTKAAIWEIQTNPRFGETWRALQGEGTAASKIHPLVYNYEVPADKPGAESKRLGFLGALPSTLDAGGAPSPSSSYDTGGKTATSDIPSVDAEAKAFDVYAGGGFKIPGSGEIIGTNADITHPAAIKAHHALMRRHRALIHHHRRHRALMHHHHRHHALIQHHRALMKELSKSELMYLESGGGKSDGLKKPKISSEEFGKWLEAHPEGSTPEGKKQDFPVWYKSIQEEGGFDPDQFDPIKKEPWGNLNPYKERPGGRYLPLQHGDPDYKSQEQQASYTPHIGDMNMFQMNKGIKLHVNNPSGMDIVAQTAMLSAGQGNFGA